MSLQRRASDFRGWQSDLDYLAAEAEHKKRVDEAVEAYERMQREDEIRPLALKWRLTIIVASALLASFIFWEALTWVIDAVRQAVGR